MISMGIRIIDRLLSSGPFNKSVQINEVSNLNVEDHTQINELD